MDLARQLGREPALADTRWTAQGDEPARAGLDALPALTQPGELAGATRERRRRRRVELARQLDDARLEGESLVLAQDRVLQLPQLRPGLNADVLDEPPARVLKSLEGLGLSATAVQGEHELTGELLAGGVIRYEQSQLADEIGVLARLEVSGHARLERGKPLFLEPRDVRLREGLEGQVGEWSAAPEPEPLSQHAGGALGIAARQSLAALLDTMFEARRVELARQSRS